MTDTQPTSSVGENTRPKNTTNRKPLIDLRTKYGQFLLIVIAIAASTLIPILPQLRLNSFISFISTFRNAQPSSAAPSQPAAPLYWIHQKSHSEHHLKHVHAVIQRLGLQRSAANHTGDWDLLWAHDYPFRALHPHLHRLKPHQLVNHFPGTGYLTTKVDLATTKPPLEYVPPAFRLPADRQALLAYAEAHPDAQFVQKHNQHRHVYVRRIDQIQWSDSESFVQVFVDRPYLVGGHKFDMGVYVTVTSVDPLRVYVYSGDVLFRYCPLPYYPFDAEKLDKYVVGDDYMPTWEVPELREAYTKLGYGMRGAFESYVRGKGEQPERIWEQVEAAVREAVMAKERHIVEALKAYPHRRNFFEMMRFDLGLDADLNVYLMEANMSPNLSSAHFVQNQLLYEQVLYNLMQLVGVASPLQRSTFAAPTGAISDMISATKNIMVAPEVCSQLPCSESCAPVQCQLCRPCLQPDDVLDLHAAYAEHLRRGENRRIFPTTGRTVEELAAAGWSRKNTLLAMWYRRKCEEDEAWCS